MSNPSKAKGTDGETTAVRWFRLNGFPGADRQPLRGNRDCGDLALAPGLVAEVKTFRLPTGVPTGKQLEIWMTQAETERRNARADFCPLIVKRPGTRDVGRWFAYMVLEDLMPTDYSVPGFPYQEPVMMSVSAMAQMFRAVGYGTPLEVTE